MGQRAYIELTCDICKDGPEIVEADDTGSVNEEDCPSGWLFVHVQIPGLGAVDEMVYCEECCLPILELLGYESYEQYQSVVKAQADIDQRYARKADEQEDQELMVEYDGDIDDEIDEPN